MIFGWDTDIWGLRGSEGLLVVPEEEQHKMQRVGCTAATGSSLQLGLISAEPHFMFQPNGTSYFDQKRLLRCGVDKEAARQKPPSCPGTDRLPE